MASETKDPRLPVLANELLVVFELGAEGYKERHAVDGRTVKALARLDAADPLRAMWGELVKKVEALCHSATAVADKGSTKGNRASYPMFESDFDDLRDEVENTRDLLTRLRTLTPTEGGTDDEAS